MKLSLKEEFEVVAKLIFTVFTWLVVASIPVIIISHNLSVLFFDLIILLGIFSIFSSFAIALWVVNSLFTN